MLLPVSNLKRIVTLNEEPEALPPQKAGREARLRQALHQIRGRKPDRSLQGQRSSVEITKVLEFHARKVMVASTGNMAASISAYGAKAGLEVTIVVPEGTPEKKLTQAKMYGAKVEVFGKTYDEALAEAERKAMEEDHYLTGNYHYRVEGQKTTGFEILDQLRYNVPGWIVVPIGAGTHLRAIWKGVTEFYRVGLIEELPRIAGAQIEGYDAIVKAWRTGKPVERVEKKVPTIARAIAVKKPVDGENAIKAVRESGGHLDTVTNKETAEAGMLLGREYSWSLHRQRPWRWRRRCARRG